MFLLRRPDLPREPEALARALEEGLRVFVSRSGPMVTVQGSDVHALDALSVDLSGAKVESLEPPPRPQLSEREPGVAVREFSINAQPVFVAGAQIAFKFSGIDVEFEQAKQPDKKLLLIINRAGSGQVRIEAAKDELERLIAGAAGKFAQRQGVTIESVKLDLTQPEPRMLNAKVTVSARKMLFRAVLNLSGSVAVSDELVATVSNLRCTGEGAIAKLACAAITPQFARVERRPFPLSALPVGEVQLRDVAFALAKDRITIRAQFGESLEVRSPA